MDTIDCLVIGAGVVGLAVARALARRGREVLVVEREAAIATVASARNSEVIHAGLHYEPGSLKARLCGTGRDRLYDWCERRSVPHRRIGKLIVATVPAQIPALEDIAARAAANGVDDLRWLDAGEVRSLEPELHADRALLSPSTGIVDASAYAQSLLADAQEAGASLVLRTTVTRIVIVEDGAHVFFDDAGSPMLHVRTIVNAAGADAPAVASLMEGFPRNAIPGAWFAKGSYFALAGRSPFRRLVYPVPEPGGLGVHLTLDLADGARFGPDVEWLDAPDHAVDPSRAASFERAIRAWWPNLPRDALVPAYAGVRPKIVGPGAPAADFRIDGPQQHRVPGIVQMFGVESPGLTASLSIADEVADRCEGAEVRDEME